MTIRPLSISTLRLGVIAVSVLTLPGSAVAATATSDGKNIVVAGPPGESFTIGIGGLSAKPGVLELQAFAPVPLQAGAGCTQRSTSFVSCSVSGVPRVVVDLGDGDDRVGIDNVEPMRVEVTGGPGNDILSGDSSIPEHPVVTVFDGGPGNDTLFPGRGPDTLRGGEGEDTVNYGLGVDAPTSISLDGVADDGQPGEGDDVGSDIEVVYGADKAPNTIVASGVATPVRVFGGDAADRIVGGAGADSLAGHLGDDVLEGGPGDDAVLGNDGADRLDGGPGVDRLGGGTGDDTLIARDGEPDESVDCGEGSDMADLDAQLDHRLLKGCERVKETWAGPPRLIAELRRS